jgi:hypothetical protein
MVQIAIDGTLLVQINEYGGIYMLENQCFHVPNAWHIFCLPCYCQAKRSMG